LVVDHDAHARIDFEASVFKIGSFDVWPAADGDKQKLYNIGFKAYKVAAGEREI
jgi:hypothetical protein